MNETLINFNQDDWVLIILISVVSFTLGVGIIRLLKNDKIE